MAELLTHAYRVSFSGQLLLECEDDQRHSIGLLKGAVCSAASTTEDSHLERIALAETLPSDTLRFVEAHAERLGTGLIGAAGALALLSEGARDLTMRKLVELRVMDTVSLPPSTVFAFFESAGRRESSDGPAEPLEPLGLILKSLLVEPVSDRFRRHVQPFENAKLYLVPDSPALHGSFPAPLRNLVQSLRGEPQTIAELLARGAAPDLQVYALIHMLRLTHQIRVSAEPTIPSPLPKVTERVPRTISGGALRAATASVLSRSSHPLRSSHAARSSHPSNSSQPSPALAASLPEHLRAALRPARLPGSLPPRASLEPPNQTEAELQRRWPERGAEARALQEWANAQGDPSQLEHAIAVVDRLARLFPRNPRIRYYSGCLLAMAGRVEPALRELREALELDPTSPETILELDRLKKRAGL